METRAASARGAEPIPEPAVPAILAAFDKYEVVGMPVAHGLKDVDDFILSLIRTPAFADKANDIVVECGNSLCQPELDRYIAGEDVSFKSVRKVWRNTTTPMCGLCGFFELFFPLMRVINQKLPPEKRLRVLAGDPPVDWEKVKSPRELHEFMDRDASIASVLEKEVLSKYRKALMLFGTSHLMHGRGAASIYERNYPNISLSSPTSVLSIRNYQTYPPAPLHPGLSPRSPAPRALGLVLWNLSLTSLRRGPGSTRIATSTMKS